MYISAIETILSKIEELEKDFCKLRTNDGQRALTDDPIKRHLFTTHPFQFGTLSPAPCVVFLCLAKNIWNIKRHRRRRSFHQSNLVRVV